MRFYNICTKKEYMENGENKVRWYKAGILKITEAGRQYIHLFHQPATDFYVFERESHIDSIAEE
jgi:hypothetical protein